LPLGNLTSLRQHLDAHADKQVDQIERHVNRPQGWDHSPPLSVATRRASASICAASATSWQRPPWNSISAIVLGLGA
jgi:hypothetical protein